MKTLKVKISELKEHPNPDVLFRRLCHKPYPFYLRGSLSRFHRDMTDQSSGRYSFLGADPFLVLKSKGHKIFLETRGEPGRTEPGRVYSYRGNPFEELRKVLSSYQIPKKSYPVPFVGGGVGYFGYDLCHFLEKLPRRAKDDLSASGGPDLFFAFYDRIFACDHKKNKMFLVQLYPRLSSRTPRWPSGNEAIPFNLRLPRHSLPVTTDLANPGGSEPLKSNFTKTDYLKAIRRAKEYIRTGDIYQVNLSQRFSVHPHTKDFGVGAMVELFKRLNRINPAPFSAFLQPAKDQYIISASPERFLKMRNRLIETRPIKGTRPRGRNPAQDRRLKQELYQSIKDNAELAMIVDLERNDLGRVASYGTVKVTQPKVVETHPTVFHLVATVAGQLAAGYDMIDLIKATFPGGSITGAPKIRAMEIIDELEPTRRNVYTGAIGYLGFDETMDLAIAIRIFMINKNGIYFQAGGGIVADSDPASEYRETIDKVKGLIKTLGVSR